MEWKTLEKEYLFWMEEEKKQVEARLNALRLKGCGDDAMLERIRLNIYEAFGAVIRAGEKQKPGEEKAFCLKKFDEIPGIWAGKMAQARENQDIKAIAIEEVKLETARHLKEKLLKMTEETI